MELSLGTTQHFHTKEMSSTQEITLSERLEGRLDYDLRFQSQGKDVKIN